MGEDRPGRRPQGRAGLIALHSVSGLDPAIGPLAEAAARERHGMMRRLVDDWSSGANRFERPGEVFLGTWLDGRLVGVGGLNRDPYADDDLTGRVRHVFVLPGARRSGVGTALLREIIARAPQTFRVLRLRTFTPDAAAFYAALGFAETSEPEASHRMEWPA
ncbi:MAG TPA: GNAT family N-acetyltransferase [Croceibacterium sp.]